MIIALSVYSTGFIIWLVLMAVARNVSTRDPLNFHDVAFALFIAVTWPFWLVLALLSTGESHDAR